MRRSYFAGACTLALCYCLLYSVPASYAQTQVYYGMRVLDTVYTLQERPATNFFFPNFDELKERHTGYRVSHQDTLLLHKKRSSSPSTLLTRFYTKNIKTVLLSINGQSPVTLSFSRNGYQFPSTTELHKADTATVLPVIVSYEKTDTTAPAELILGDMYAGNYNISYALSPVALFRKRPFDNSTTDSDYTLSPFDSYGQYAYYPVSQIEEATRAALFIRDTVSDTKQLLQKTLSVLLSNYPFYKEKKLDKIKVQRDLSNLFNSMDTASLCRLTDTVSNYLSSTFADPHFTLKAACEKGVPSYTPLYAYLIDGRYQVGAMLDDKMQAEIPLGSEILEIDRHNISGKNSVSSVNNRLKKKQGDSVALRLKYPSGKYASVTYKVAGQYKIPASFNPPNLSYKKINDTTVYYRISRIDAHLPTDFLSRLDSINEARRLIIDLRGCGGGDPLAGAQFLTYIIRHPFRYFDFQPLNKLTTDSVIVGASHAPVAYRTDGRIMILVDKNTACTAELLVHGIRTYMPNSTIVGREATRGALSIIYNINFPKNDCWLSTNALNEWKILLNGRSIEDKGISPDVMVDIHSVWDLQPYRDKVLQLAISK